MSTCQIMLLLSVCQKPAQTPAHEFSNKDIIHLHAETSIGLKVSCTAIELGNLFKRNTTSNTRKKN